MYVRRTINKRVNADERSREREQTASVVNDDRANEADYSTNKPRECIHQKETESAKQFTFSHEEDHNHCSFVLERRSRTAVQIFNSKMCPTSLTSVNCILTNYSIVNDFIFGPPRPTYSFESPLESNKNNNNNNYSKITNHKEMESSQQFVEHYSDRNNCKYGITNSNCHENEVTNTNSHENHLCSNLATTTEVNEASSKQRRSALLPNSGRCDTCPQVELEEYEEEAQFAPRSSVKSHIRTTHELLFIPQNFPFSSYSKINKDSVWGEASHEDVPNSCVAELLICDNPIPCLVVKPKEMMSSHVAIYFHCNGEDIGHTQNDRLQTLADALHLLILAPEFPGYGLSTGNLSENSVKRSMERFIRFVFLSNPSLTPSQVILIGYSIGTGLAMHIAKVIHEAFQSAQHVLQLPKKFIQNASTEIRCEAMCDMLHELETHESSTNLHASENQHLKNEERAIESSSIGQHAADENTSSDRINVNTNCSNCSSNCNEPFRTHINCNSSNNNNNHHSMMLSATERGSRQSITNCNQEQRNTTLSNVCAKDKEWIIDERVHLPLSNSNANESVKLIQNNVVKHEHTTSYNAESFKNDKCNRVNVNTSCTSSLEESHLRTSHNVATTETASTLCAHCALGGIVLIAPFISLHAVENVKAFGAYKLNLEELYELEQTIPVNMVYSIPTSWNTMQMNNVNRHKYKKEREQSKVTGQTEEKQEQQQQIEQLNRQSTNAEHSHLVEGEEEQNITKCCTLGKMESKHDAGYNSHLQRSKESQKRSCHKHHHHNNNSNERINEDQNEKEGESTRTYSQVLLEREWQPFIFRVAFYTTCERFANILIAQKLQQKYNFFAHTPLLLIHGTHDVMISPSHSIAMAAAIRQCGSGTAARVFVTLVDGAEHNNVNCTHFIRHFYKHQILYPHLQRVAKEHALCRKELLSEHDQHTDESNTVWETCTGELQQLQQNAEQSLQQEKSLQEQELHSLHEESEEMEHSTCLPTESKSKSVYYDPANVNANVQSHSNEPFCESHATQEDHMHSTSNEIRKQTEFHVEDRAFVDTRFNSNYKSKGVNSICAEKYSHKESQSSEMVNVNTTNKDVKNTTTHTNPLQMSFFSHMPSIIWDLQGDHEFGNYYARLPFNTRWHIDQLRLSPQHYDVGSIMVEAMKMYAISAIDAERLYKRYVYLMWLCRSIAACMYLLFAFFILVVGIVHEIFTRSHYIAPEIVVSTSAYILRHEPRIIAWSVIECTTMLTLFALRLLHARYSFGKWSKLTHGDYSWVLIYMCLRFLSIVCIFAIGVCMGMILAFASPHTIGVDWGRWDALPYYHRVWVSVVPRWTMVAAASLHLFMLLLSAVKNH